MGSKRDEMLKKYSVSNNQTNAATKPSTSAGSVNRDIQAKDTPKQNSSLREKMLAKYSVETNARDVDEDFVNTFFSDASSYFDKAKADYDKVGYSTARSIYKSNYDDINNLMARSQDVRSYLRNNRNAYGQKNYDALNTQLTQIEKLLDQYSRSFYETKQNVSQFKSESEYNNALQQYEWGQKYKGKTMDDLSRIAAGMTDGSEKDFVYALAAQMDYDAKAGYDVAAGRQEIEALEKQLADLRLQQTAASFGPRANRDNGAAQYAEQIRQLEQEIARKKQYANQSQYIQKGETLKGVTGNADFGANSGYVSTIDENPAWGMSGVGDNLYEWINDRDGFRDTYERDMARLDTMAGGRKMESPYIQKGYDRMTDQEVAIYNYYYATEGKEKAEEYLHSIQEQLNTRKATELFEGMQGKTGQELVFGVEAGLDQFQSGMQSLINTKDDYIAQSTKQIASGMVREDLEDDSIPMWYNFKTGQWEQQILGSSAGQMAYDAITTSANMAPSILTSIAVGMINPVAGQIAGSALMGASAAGSAYQEKLNAGYDKNQARSYGILVGASEIVMEKVLGGITKLGGGMISSSILKNLSAVDNVLARFAKSMGGQILMGAGSEALEEGVQSVLEPFILQAVTGEEASIDWQEAMYSALLGFATGGMFEGADVVYNTSVQNREAKQQYGASQQEIVNKALKLDKENAFAQKMQGKINKGKNLSGKQIRELLASNQKQITEKDMQKIQAAAEKRLTELGQTKEDVSKIAELATKYATGQELSTADKRLLASSKYGSRVANELMPQNIASGDYSTEWAEEIGTEQVNKAAYNKKALVQQIVDAMASFEDPAQYKALTDRTDAATRFSVSQGEQATVRSTGEAFDINNAEVASIKPNEVTFKTADGNEVSANDIDFADEDQSFLVAAVSGIENITPAAASAVMHDVVDTSKPLGNQLNGIDEAYTYGFNGYSVEDLKAGSYTGSLTETQLMSAYQLGQSARRISDTSKVENIKKMRTAAQALTEKAAAEGKEAPKANGMTITYNHGSGKVESIDQANLKGLSDHSRAGIEMAKVLHKLGIGGNYEFFSSYLSKTMTDEKGNAVRVFLNDEGVEEAAYSGLYRKGDGTIRIDLNAYSGRGLTVNALAHELTHFIQQWSGEKYKVLADFLVKTYEGTDMTMHERVLREQARLERIRKKAVSYTEAYNEVVANAMGKMLDDGKLVERLTELRATDKDLAQKLWEGFKKILGKFFGLYEKESALFHDTADLMEMKEAFEQLRDMFAEALSEASDNFQASLIAQETEAVKSLGENAKVETNADGELLLAANERGNVLMYSEHTYLNGGREKLEMALRQNGHTAEEIEQTLSYVDDALDYIKILAAGYAKNMGYTNMSDHLIADIVTNVKTGKQVMSAIVNNGDYPVNIDLSLICKKRVAYMNLMSRLIRDGVFDKVNYGGAAIAEVNEILRENGFETACLGCFVESRRLQFQAWAETIVSEWNAEVDKRNPNAENFGFAKGKMEALTDENINELTRELESVKKNDQGNVNLGQGNSVTRMGRLLDALPSLQKKLTIEDLLTPEGLTALRKHDGSLFSIVKSRYGAASPKIVQDFNPYAGEIAMLTFAQVKGITNNAVKGAQAYVTEVKREYGKLKKNKDESKADFNQRKKDHEQKIQDEAMRRYLYDIGGARIQSFSDFMIENVFDYIQIFADLAAKRLPLHGYSKEIVAIRLFGMTGAKWNGSLIAHVERSMGKELAGLLPAGTKDGIPVTVDGKDYVIGFDDYARNAATGGKSFIQSIGMKDIVALQLDPRYSPYVGSITIGVSDAQILAMLDSPVFRMVIPYHASGMLPQFAKLVGVDMYNDYTDYQNTTVRQYYDLNGNAVTELKNAKGETVKADTSFAFNAEIQKTKDAKTAADNYLKWCAQRHEVYDGSKLVGYATFNPKFSSSPYGNDFTRHENYYKLLEDFNTYDCITEASTVQGAVTMNFPSEANRLSAQQMEAYKQALRETGIFTEKDVEKYAKKADMTFKEIIAAETDNRANYAKEQNPKWESTVKAIEAKLQKDYAREQYSSQETDFDYSGLNWASDLGIITGKDRAIFERTINNEIYRGAKPQSANGEYIIDTGKCLMFTDGDFHRPTLSRVIEFATEYESLTDDAKRRIIDEAEATGEVQQSIQAIKIIFGQGFVSSHIPPAGYTYAGQNRRGKGSNGSRTNQKARSLKDQLAEEGLDHLLEDSGSFQDIRFSGHETDNISNRDLLANAFEGISRNSIEYQMIQEYKGHIEQLNELETKLSQLNAEIRKIRFGKGEYDAEKLRQLESKAGRIAKDINRYDKRLLNMEASEPLRKVIERERKKEAQKTKAHVKEIQENKKVRAEQAELRHKIRKAVRDLDKVLNHGNKKLNVKEDMQNVVTKALKAADILFTDNYGNYDMLRNGIGADMSDSEEALVKTCAKMLKDLDAMPTDGYDNWQARQEAEKQLRTKMSKLKEVFARERKRLNNTTVSSVLGELADAYASLEKSEQSYVQGAYTEAVHNFLKSLQSEVGGTIVKDMTKDQLESVYAAYKMVLTTVRKANQMFNEDLKQTREQLGNAVIQEVIKAGGTHGLWTKGEIAKNQADWNNLKPIWVANRIGSDTFGKLMNGLFKGQYNFAVDVEEAKQFKQSMDQKYKPRDWDTEKLYEFESSTESKFSLNLQQIMSIYAFSKREQAYSHLLNGGFVFESNSTVVVDKKGIKRTYLHDGATSYKLNVETLGEIINALTAEQKAYVDEMQAYLSDVMGAKGNEVSMKLYGIRMFKEKFYFPLRSSGAYMERAKEAELKKEQGQINLVNSGFTHSVKPEAKNPIVLSGFLDVWAEHCNEMSMYHSMVLPMEDFRKVYNYSTIHTENAESASVYQTIQDAYGKAATNYIDQLYRELNAGATVDPRETPFKAWISKFKKAAVMLSASVVVQQFSSVGRAFALIDPDHFAGAKVNSGTGLSAADEMKKYAPVAIIKEMGGFDTGTKGSAKSYIMAEQYNEGERLKGLVKDEQYRSEIMGYLPAKADEVTWVSIWEAVKRETRAKHPKMDVKSEQFLALAGERFSEIIEKTQVYDSVLARSANMRSKGVFMSMATAFMAEPTTTINLLEDALRGRSTKKIARTFGAVAVSIVLNNALASIVYAMRDDDEDETFIEKYFQSFTSGMIDDLNPMSYYPFLKDVYSLFQGYDVERADMSVIADLRDAVKKLIPILGKDTSEMDDAELAAHQKQLYSGLMSLLDACCSAFGVPVKNVRRDVNAIINTFKTVRADLTERDTTWRSFWDKVGAAAKDTVPVFAWTSDRTKQDKIYDAIMAGDAEYVSRLKSGYKTDSSYQSAARKALRENDPRIHEAAVAWNNNELDEYMRIAREIIAEKRFVQDDVVAAIRSEASSIAPDPEAAATSKAKGLFTADKFASAIAQGDNETARAIRADVIQTAQQNGKTKAEAERSFQSTAKGDLKEMFLAGTLAEAKAISALVNYCGENREKAEEYVDEWTFQKKYGFSYDDRKSAYMSGKITAREMKNVLINMGGLTEENAELQVQAYDWNAEGYEDATVTAVRNYIEYCAEYNVPKDVYMKIRKFSNNTENDVDKETGKTINYSAMKTVMAEIHKQDLTAEQKTAIAKSLGWSSKNIRKYKLW